MCVCLCVCIKKERGLVREPLSLARTLCTAPTAAALCAATRQTGKKKKKETTEHTTRRHHIRASPSRHISAMLGGKEGHPLLRNEDKKQDRKRERKGASPAFVSLFFLIGQWRKKIGVLLPKTPAAGNWPHSAPPPLLAGTHFSQISACHALRSLRVSLILARVLSIAQSPI